jgi:TctA family transporter
VTAQGSSSTAASPALSPTSPVREPSFWGTVLTIARKDIQIEWRGRGRINATLFFAILTLLLFSFAMGPESKLLTRVAGGFFWLALLLSSVMSLSESMRIERDNFALEGVRLIPVSPMAFFLGKALVNSLYLWLLSLVLMPMVAGVYGAGFTGLSKSNHFSDRRRPDGPALWLGNAFSCLRGGLLGIVHVAFWPGS